MTDTPVVFWQMQPCWGLPNASPFCMKLETWLRLAGIPYEARTITGPPKSESGKVPYVERAGGSYLADSALIIQTLSRERGVDLDAELTPSQRAMCVLLTRTFEEDLYFIALHDRWVIPANWAKTRDAFFGKLPWALRTLVVPQVRRKVIAAARGQGVLRLPRGRREAKALEDLSAIAQVLGDQEYFCGARPSTIDATAYAFLANLLWAPIESPVTNAMREHASLVAYCERFRERHW